MRLTRLQVVFMALVFLAGAVTGWNMREFTLRLGLWPGETLQDYGGPSQPDRPRRPGF